MCFLTAIFNYCCCKRPLNDKKHFNVYENDMSLNKTDDLISQKSCSLIIMSEKSDQHAFIGDYGDVRPHDEIQQKKNSNELTQISIDNSPNDTNSINSSVILNKNSSFLSLSSLSECSSCNSSTQSIVHPRISGRPMQLDFNLNANKGPTRPNLQLFSDSNKRSVIFRPMATTDANNDVDSNSDTKHIINNRKTPENNKRPILNGLNINGSGSLKQDFIKSNALLSQIYNDLKKNTISIKKPIADSRQGKLTINDKDYELNDQDIVEISEIGRGEFGYVVKALHKPTSTLIALKKTSTTQQYKAFNKELEILIRCNSPWIVKFYGFKFNNKLQDSGIYSIYMEIMDTSLDKFYKCVYDAYEERIPETILGQILIATLNALSYLKDSLKTIHRDVKPSNILVNRRGEIKLCDFGISGHLINSVAHSTDVGCRIYMSPERIQPPEHTKGYDVRSDVWSLGISCYELATGRFPYPLENWTNVFQQLDQVVNGPAPRLADDYLSENFKNFVNICLEKDVLIRPKYKDLVQHAFIIEHSAKTINVSAYVTPYIEKIQSMSQP